MTFSCDLTSSGLSLTWDASDGEASGADSVQVVTGLGPEPDETHVLSGFTGTGILSATGADGPLPGVFARLEALDGASVIKTSRTLPLIPGLSFSELCIAFAAYEGFRRRSLKVGFTAGFYRRNPSPETVCTVCRDSATGLSMSASCPTCGGTGYTDGWWGPYTVYVQAPAGFGAGVANAAGADYVARGTQLRMSAFPRPAEDDVVWLSGQRRMFVLGPSLKTMNQVRGFPVTVAIPAREAVPTDPDFAGLSGLKGL